MKRILFLLLLALSAPAVFSQIPGIWQNSSRFVEFSSDGQMRIVMKPYYGFVYEDTGPLPCAITEDASVPTSPIFSLSIKYTGERKEADIPVVRIGDALFFRFYRKAAVGSASPASGTTLDGFYQAAGNNDALRLYRSDPLQEFYCFYFSNDAYYRIRYWAADVRPRDIQAHFTGLTGETLSIPKFITIDTVLYTCITSTGSVLRNFERGTYTVTDGFAAFKPDNIVFEGTAASIMKSTRITISPDGQLLALGEPYLTKSKVTSLDEEIKAHNALRRPPRKPIFGFMNLDFHWDEIERIRNGT